MHGSLLDSHQRLSLTGSADDGLFSSENTLTDDEPANKASDDIQSDIRANSITQLPNSSRSVHDGDNASANPKAHPTEFFRWQRGHRHVMLTFCTICLFAFMTGVEYAVILPTAFDYVKTMANADIYVGLILSSYSISGSIMGIIMGKISDVIGKVKLLILIAAVFEIAGNILYFTGNNIRIVLLGRFVSGVGMGAVPPILADVAHRTTESERTKAISIILGCRQLGLLIGPCFTLLIRLMNFHIGPVRVYNLNGPGFLMASIWLILVIVCWFCFHDRARPATVNSSRSSLGGHSPRQGEHKVSFRTYRDQYVRMEMFVLFLATFITYFNQTALETIVAAFTEKHFKWTVVHTSLLFAFAGLEIILVYVALVKIFSRRFEDRVLLIFGFASLLLACAIGTYFNWASHALNWFRAPSTGGVNKSLFSLFIAFVIFDLLGLPFIAATSVSLFTKLTSKELQGFSQGVQRSVMGLGTIIGPLFASSLLNRLHIMMTVMLALTLLTAVAILVVLKRLRPTPGKISHDEHDDLDTNRSLGRASSLKNVDHQSELGLVLPSKGSYVALVQHDDEHGNGSPIAMKRPASGYHSNGDTQSRASAHSKK